MSAKKVGQIPRRRYCPELAKGCTADVPDLKLNVFIHDLLDVAADCGLCLDYLSQIAKIKKVATADTRS